MLRRHTRAVIRIEVRNVCHRQNFAGVHIQHHGRRAQRPGIPHGLGQMMLCGNLNPKIQTKLQITPMVDRPNTLNILYDSALAIAQHARAPLDARQVAVKRPLDPFLSAVVYVSKTEDVAGNGSGRVIASVLTQ